MHRLLIVPLFIVAVGGGAWFFNTYDQPLSFEHVLSSQEHVSTDVGEASASSRPELISGVALEGAREAIQVTRAERATEDPCDSVRAELETAILINNEHEKTIAAVKAAAGEAVSSLTVSEQASAKCSKHIFNERVAALFGSQTEGKECVLRTGRSCARIRSVSCSS